MLTRFAHQALPTLTIESLPRRRSGQGQGGGGGGGGMFGPMDLSRSGAKVQMQPDTGVTFNDVVGVDGAKLVRAPRP